MQECVEISPGKRMSPSTPDTMTLSCCSLAVRLSASPAANQPAVKPPTVKAPVAHQLVSIFCSTLCCQLCLYDQLPPQKHLQVHDLGTVVVPWLHKVTPYHLLTILLVLPGNLRNVNSYLSVGKAWRKDGVPPLTLNSSDYEFCAIFVGGRCEGLASA